MSQSFTKNVPLDTDVTLASNSDYITPSQKAVKSYVDNKTYGREILVAARTYYVRTDGSNSNNGLANTAGGAFLTIQKAYDVITSTLDLGSKAVTIQCGDGTYTAGLSMAQPWVGGGTITLTGENTTGAIITGTTSISCSVVLPGIFTVQKMKLGGSAFCILHSGVGQIAIGASMEFGASTYHLFGSAPGAYLVAAVGYTISGGASQMHAYIGTGAYLQIEGGTVTLTGTPAFGYFIYCLNLGIVRSVGTTFSGAATGTRYSATSNASIYTGGGGANYFPGNAAGSTDGFGVYT